MSTSGDLPRRLGDILVPALGKLAGSEEARAYAAWARAVGEPVARGTRPKAFRRGQLTVECASSVWANELTFLGPQILRRMDEVAPGHPVRRFRFIIGRTGAGAAHEGTDAGAAGEVTGAGAAGGAAQGEPAAEAARQDSEPPAAKEKHRDRQPAPGAAEAARAQAERVRDERLRSAIEAALRRSSEEPLAPSDRGTPGS